MSDNTIININSQLIDLLKKIIISINPLAINDYSLKKLSLSIHSYTQNSTDVPAETIISELNKIAEILESYDLKLKLKDFSNPIQTVPHLIYEAIQEIEHLMTIEKTKSPNAKLLKDITSFLNLSLKCK